MSTPTPNANTVHEDFAGTADVDLVSSDGVHFHIDSSILTRSSVFFRGMFTLPQPGADVEPQPIAVDEDALTLEILLKFASGMSAPLERLTSCDAIERAIAAADKYDMPGVRQVLLLVMSQFICNPASGLPPLHQYALASTYGLTTLADRFAQTCAMIAIDYDNIPPMASQHLSRIMKMRHTRITAFHTQILSRAKGSQFLNENSGYANCCGTPSSSTSLWTKFVLKACVQFTQTPSIDTVAQNAGVAYSIAQLEAVRCKSCNRGPEFSWRDIKRRIDSFCFSEVPPPPRPDLL